MERDGDRIIRVVPGSAFTVRYDEYVHEVAIDELGGRASGRGPDDTRPIVPIFGDSMTFGLGVRDRETWVSRVDRSTMVRLENFGMPGTDLLNQIDVLDRMHARLQAPPICFFVVYLGNDLSSIASAMDTDTGDAGAAPASWSGGLFAINEALDERGMLRRLYSVQLTRAMAVRLVHASRYEPQVRSVLALMDRRTSLDRERRAFDQAIERLARTAARLRFAPAVVIVPDRFQVEERSRRDKAAQYGEPVSSYDPRRPNAIVADALIARGISFIDTTECLAGRAGQYYVRDEHFTAAGHETIAACVREFIVDRTASIR